MGTTPITLIRASHLPSTMHQPSGTADKLSGQD